MSSVCVCVCSVCVCVLLWGQSSRDILRYKVFFLRVCVCGGVFFLSVADENTPIVFCTLQETERRSRMKD